MPRPTRSNLSRRSRNATRIRNIASERTEEEQEIAREERRFSMARLRASKSHQESEAARETARLAMRNRRANLRDEQVDNLRRTRRNISSTDLNRAAFRYDCSTDYGVHTSVRIGPMDVVCEYYSILPKKSSKQSRRSQKVSNAYENATAARSTMTVEGIPIQATSQQNLEDKHLIREHHSLCYEAVSPQSNQCEQKAGGNHQQFLLQVDEHQQDFPLLMEVSSSSIERVQPSTQKMITLRHHSKIAKTGAERARAYRERKKALKNRKSQQLEINTTQSDVDDMVALEDVSQEAIKREATTACSQQDEERKGTCVYFRKPPFTSDSSNSMTDEVTVKEEFDEVTVKEELEIGPEVFQPEIISDQRLSSFEFQPPQEQPTFHGNKVPASMPMLCIEWIPQAAVKKPKFKISSINTNLTSYPNESDDDCRASQQLIYSHSNKEAETDEVTVKEELELGPEVLQPEIISDPHLSSFETDEVTIEEELEIRPEVHQPAIISDPLRLSLETDEVTIEEELQPAIISDPLGLCFETDEVTIEEELEIRPDVHQPAIISDPLGLCFEADEVTVKEELDIGPAVLQPAIYPNILQRVPQFQPPQEQPTFHGNKVPASRPMLCIEWIPQAEVTKPKFKISSINTNLTSYPNESNDDCRASQQLIYSHSNKEAEVKLKCRNCTKLHSECYCEIGISNTETNALNENLKTHTKHVLDKHMNSSKQDKSHKCKYCDYTTCDESLLQRHLLTHTQDELYSCEHCDYTATELTELICHSRVHAGEKVYKCDQCDYSAYKHYRLKYHLRTHMSEKPYKCELCDYSASRKDYLRLHLNTHTDEKPYRCEHCDYRGSYRGNLKKHMRTHTGEKPYACQYCDFSASDRTSLKCHLRRHTGEKPYCCKYCDFRTSGRSHLKSHLRRHAIGKPYQAHRNVTLYKPKRHANLS